MSIIPLLTHIEDPLDGVQDVLDTLIPFSGYNDFHHPYYNTHPPSRLHRTGNAHVIRLKVGTYRPDEIHVEVNQDKVTVSGRHESKVGNGFQKNEFSRHYVIPQTHDPSTIRYETKNGWLTITTDEKGSTKQIEGCKVINDNKSFELALGMKGYNDKDINVSLEGDQLVIRARHCHKDQSEDGHRVSEHTTSFEKRLNLPPDVNRDQLQTVLKKDGRLVIHAPKLTNHKLTEKKLKITSE